MDAFLSKYVEAMGYSFINPSNNLRTSERDIVSSCSVLLTDSKISNVSRNSIKSLSCTGVGFKVAISSAVLYKTGKALDSA